MQEKLTFEEAIEALNHGAKITLPEWTGYWFMQDGQIKVMNRGGNVLNTPFLYDYEYRTDWQITDGKRDFGGALIAMKAGKRLAREGWNGKGMWIEIQKPNEDSRITLPYIFMHTAQGDYVPWLASQADMLSEDWIILHQ